MNNFWQYLKKRKLAFISVIFLFIIYFVMIFAEFFAPYSATLTFENNTYHPSNIQLSGKVREYRAINKITWEYRRVKNSECIHRLKWFVKGEKYKILGIIPCDRHLFGTENNAYPAYLLGADHLGRDLFSRIIYGSRISLTIGFVATAISILLAVLLGGISGFSGGSTDWTIMRISEFFMLIPSLYFILFLRSLLNTKMDTGTSYFIITIILALVGWPGTARTIRGIVHSIKREEFVVDADIEGVPPVIIIAKHIIPQISSLLIVSVTLSVPGFIMSETTLSYLGLGIADPAVSWGSLINRDISTISNLRNFPWLLYPVLMLLLVTLAFNFLGDALRDYFDPYGAVFSKKFKFNKQDFNTEKKHCENTEENVICNENTLLAVQNLKVTFQILRGNKMIPIYAARGVSFSLNKGEILGIVGESGSGKSVSTTAIPGLLPKNAFTEGHIFYKGTDLLTLSQKELREYRGKKIALIFQEPGRSFDPLQSIGKVFWETFRIENPKISKEEAYKKAEKLLSDVGIPEPSSRLSSYPHQFSGGQLQRIGIALALAQNCELLIADEPTTALDVTIQSQIISLLLKLKDEKGLSIIFISHNINLVAKISNRIAVMYGGKIMETGTPDDIINNPGHPYTQALVSALPEFGTHYTQQKMRFIPGRVSDPANPPAGCPFSPRCAFSKNECKKNENKCWKQNEK
ncbi:MAG: dipeptide/oligopeptide/nickel ABC transporter permease/ATP-binding protein [Spirochaetia bacterium]|nr:dipeptide/oligopeptide/nickel ABC transporter permease/ATP-binding protein [Spirochaetia bacterium]